MHIMRHNLQGEVLDSLLDKRLDYLSKKPNNNKIGNKISDYFFTNTELEDKRKDYVLSELMFAANREKIALSKKQINAFLHNANKKNLRGKKLERYAKKYCKYCADLLKSITLTNKNKIEESDKNSRIANKVISAMYDKDFVNEYQQNKYLGCKSNPNTILNPNAIRKIASKKSEKEKTAEKKQQIKEFKKSQKEEYWKQLHEELLPLNKLNKKIGNASFFEKYATHNPKFGLNALSMFSTDMDFSNIPEKTDGEKIKQKKESILQRKKESKKHEIKPAQKTSSMIDKIVSRSINRTIKKQIDLINKEAKSRIVKIKKSANPDLFRKLYKIAKTGNFIVKFNNGKRYVIDCKEDSIYLHIIK